MEALKVQSNTGFSTVLGLSGSEWLFNDFLIIQDLKIAFSCPIYSHSLNCMKGAQKEGRAFNI